MATTIPFLQDGAFDPDALRAMATALEEVCRTLRVDGDQRAREVIAARIIELARRGERDPKRLRDRLLREAGATSRWLPSADPLVAVADGRRPRALAAPGNIRTEPPPILMSDDGSSRVEIGDPSCQP
jgi:hypothetical protein